MAPPNPRHLAGARALPAPGRRRALLLTVGSVLVVVAVAVVWAVAGPGRRSERRAENQQVASASTAAPPTATTAGQAKAGEEDELIANPGFEASAAGWRPMGSTVLERTPTAEQGAWSVKLFGGQRGTARAGIEHGSVPVDRDAKVNQVFAAAAWVRGRPGTNVQVNLVEYVDRQRYAIDSAGTILRDTGWRQIEVYHYLHRTGSRLAVEVVAPTLPGGASLLVDGVELKPEHDES
jgi:hypothetical protein